MSIQRYDLEYEDDGCRIECLGLKEDEDGDYILHSDHAAELHNLLSTLADIRAALGVGGKPMLGELAGEVGRLKRERDEAVEALKICSDALEIALDWHAPRFYDVGVPPSWDDTKDPDSEEPEWPTGNGIVKKCRATLAKIEGGRNGQNI